jgi:hypothetical protein
MSQLPPALDPLSINPVPEQVMEEEEEDMADKEEGDLAAEEEEDKSLVDPKAEEDDKDHTMNNFDGDELELDCTIMPVQEEQEESEEGTLDNLIKEDEGFVIKDRPIDHGMRSHSPSKEERKVSPCLKKASPAHSAGSF